MKQLLLSRLSFFRCVFVTFKVVCTVTLTVAAYLLLKKTMKIADYAENIIDYFNKPKVEYGSDHTPNIFILSLLYQDV